MILKMFSVRDAKAEVFHPPFFKKTPGEAERDFQQLTLDEKSLVAKYPEDYDLWYLGEYDDNSGKMSPLPSPQHVVKAIALVPPSNVVQHKSKDLN